MGRFVFALFLLAGIPAFAAEDEPSAIIEIGGAGEWGVHHGDTAYGPSLAAETTPIPDVLEIEAGTTEFFPHGATEWDTDFLFKAPFTLSDTLEFMAGVGPEWAHTVTHGTSTDSFGAESGAGLYVLALARPEGGVLLCRAQLWLGILAPAIPSRPA